MLAFFRSPGTKQVVNRGTEFDRRYRLDNKGASLDEHGAHAVSKHLAGGVENRQPANSLNCLLRRCQSGLQIVTLAEIGNKRSGFWSPSRSVIACSTVPAESAS